MTATLNIMLVASAGGHWIELMRLRPAWRELRATYVSTDPELAEEVRRISLQEQQAFLGYHSLVEANRWQKFRLLRLILQLIILLVRARPDIILTTGAAPGYFALRIGRVLGARTIWVDSIANADELSLSGQKAGKYADLWLTQWKHLAKPHGPHYLGSVL